MDREILERLRIIEAQQRAIDEKLERFTLDPAMLKRPRRATKPIRENMGRFQVPIEPGRGRVVHTTQELDCKNLNVQQAFVTMYVGFDNFPLRQGALIWGALEGTRGGRMIELAVQQYQSQINYFGTGAYGFAQLQATFSAVDVCRFVLYASDANDPPRILEVVLDGELVASSTYG